MKTSRAIWLVLLVAVSLRAQDETPKLWERILPPGTIEIETSVNVPSSEIVRGSGRGKTFLRSTVPNGEFALNWEGTSPYGGGCEDLTIVIVTPGSGGIRASGCQSLLIRNVLIRSAKNPIRQGGVGILLDSGRKGSAYCRLDFVDVFLCDVGLQLKTSVAGPSWSNRHTITALRCWQCGIGLDLDSSATNTIVGASFESCDQSVRFGARSHRNLLSMVEEKNKAPITLEYGANGNQVNGIHAGYVYLPKVAEIPIE